MNKHLFFGIATLIIVLLVTVSALALSFGGVKKRNIGIDIQLNQNIKEAIQSEDYNVYIKALEENMKSKIQSLTEEKFKSIVDRYKKEGNMRNSINKEKYSVKNKPNENFPTIKKFSMRKGARGNISNDKLILNNTSLR